LTAYVGWGDAPLTQATCSSARLEVSMLRGDAGWHLVGTARYAGRWLLGLCVLRLSESSGSLTTLRFPFTQVRATGAAYLGNPKKKVRVGFRNGTSC
jgi:hypothetical protein